jgi:hypothetical protein
VLFNVLPFKVKIRSLILIDYDGQLPCRSYYFKSGHFLHHLHLGNVAYEEFRFHVLWSLCCCYKDAYNVLPFVLPLQVKHCSVAFFICIRITITVLRVLLVAEARNNLYLHHINIFPLSQFYSHVQTIILSNIRNSITFCI